MKLLHQTLVCLCLTVFIHPSYSSAQVFGGGYPVGFVDQTIKKFVGNDDDLIGFSISGMEMGCHDMYQKCAIRWSMNSRRLRPTGCTGKSCRHEDVAKYKIGLRVLDKKGKEITKKLFTRDITQLNTPGFINRSMDGLDFINLGPIKMNLTTVEFWVEELVWRDNTPLPDQADNIAFSVSETLNVIKSSKEEQAQTIKPVKLESKFTGTSIATWSVPDIGIVTFSSSPPNSFQTTGSELSNYIRTHSSETSTTENETIDPNVGKTFDPGHSNCERGCLFFIWETSKNIDATFSEETRQMVDELCNKIKKVIKVEECHDQPLFFGEKCEAGVSYSCIQLHPTYSNLNLVWAPKSQIPIVIPMRGNASKLKIGDDKTFVAIDGDPFKKPSKFEFEVKKR